MMEMRGVFYTADAVKHHPLLALTILKLHFQLYFNDIGLPAELDAVISILKTHMLIKRLTAVYIGSVVFSGSV